MVDTCDVSELVLVSDVEFVRLCDEVASAIDKYAATIATQVCVKCVCARSADDKTLHRLRDPVFIATRTFAVAQLLRSSRVTRSSSMGLQRIIGTLLFLISDLLSSDRGLSIAQSGDTLFELRCSNLANAWLCRSRLDVGLWAGELEVGSRVCFDCRRPRTS